MSQLKLWDQLEEWKKNCTWVELTRELSPETPHWFGFPALEAKTFLDLDSSIFLVHTYQVVGQYGTHVDIGAHMVKGARTLDQVTPEELVLPLCVIDTTEAVAENPDFVISQQDIQDWEAIHGPIPAGSFVALRSDWSKRAPETLDNEDAEGNRHFPGWGMDALEYLVETRHVGAIGHETSDTEAPITSSATSYAAERYILAQNRFQIEMLINLDKCPPKGALIFCSFPKLKDGTGFPARCFALCPPGAA